MFRCIPPIASQNVRRIVLIIFRRTSFDLNTRRAVSCSISSASRSASLKALSQRTPIVRPSMAAGLVIRENGRSYPRLVPPCKMPWSTVDSLVSTEQALRRVRQVQVFAGISLKICESTLLSDSDSVSYKIPSFAIQNRSFH